MECLQGHREKNSINPLYYYVFPLRPPGKKQGHQSGNRESNSPPLSFFPATTPAVSRTKYPLFFSLCNGSQPFFPAFPHIHRYYPPEPPMLLPIRNPDGSIYQTLICDACRKPTQLITQNFPALPQSFFCRPAELLATRDQWESRHIPRTTLLAMAIAAAHPAMKRSLVSHGIHHRLIVLR